eukprot:522290_1
MAPSTRSTARQDAGSALTNGSTRTVRFLLESGQSPIALQFRPLPEASSSTHRRVRVLCDGRIQSILRFSLVKPKNCFDAAPKRFSNNYEIRRFKQSDIPFLIRMDREMSRDLDCVPYDKDWLRAITSWDPNRKSYRHYRSYSVATRDKNAPVACLIMCEKKHSWNRGYMELFFLAVWKKHRRRGIATELVKLCERLAFEDFPTCLEVRLHVVNRNVQALKMYRGYGYSLHALKRAYPNPHTSCWRMCKVVRGREALYRAHIERKRAIRAAQKSAESSDEYQPARADYSSEDRSTVGGQSESDWEASSDMKVGSRKRKVRRQSRRKRKFRSSPTSDSDRPMFEEYAEPCGATDENRSTEAHVDHPMDSSGTESDVNHAVDSVVTHSVASESAVGSVSPSISPLSNSPSISPLSSFSECNSVDNCISSLKNHRPDASLISKTTHTAKLQESCTKPENIVRYKIRSEQPSSCSTFDANQNSVDSKLPVASNDLAWPLPNVISFSGRGIKRRVSPVVTAGSSDTLRTAKIQKLIHDHPVSSGSMLDRYKEMPDAEFVPHNPTNSPGQQPQKKFTVKSLQINHAPHSSDHAYTGGRLLTLSSVASSTGVRSVNHAPVVPMNGGQQLLPTGTMSSSSGVHTNHAPHSTVIPYTGSHFVNHAPNSTVMPTTTHRKSINNYNRQSSSPVSCSRAYHTSFPTTFLSTGGNQLNHAPHQTVLPSTGVIPQHNATHSTTISYAGGRLIGSLQHSKFMSQSAGGRQLNHASHPSPPSFSGGVNNARYSTFSSIRGRSTDHVIHPTSVDFGSLNAFNIPPSTSYSRMIVKPPSRFGVSLPHPLIQRPPVNLSEPDPLQSFVPKQNGLRKVPPTVLSGGSQPTVLSGGSQPTVLSGASQPTVLSGGSQSGGSQQLPMSTSLKLATPPPPPTSLSSLPPLLRISKFPLFDTANQPHALGSQMSGNAAACAQFMHPIHSSNIDKSTVSSKINTPVPNHQVQIPGLHKFAVMPGSPPVPSVHQVPGLRPGQPVVFVPCLVPSDLPSTSRHSFWARERNAEQQFRKFS